MKNIIAVVVLMVWSLLFVFPNPAYADEASDRILRGAAIGAVIGAAVGIVIYLTTPKYKKQAKFDKQNPMTKSSKGDLKFSSRLELKEDHNRSSHFREDQILHTTFKVSF